MSYTSEKVLKEIIEAVKANRPTPMPRLYSRKTKERLMQQIADVTECRRKGMSLRLTAIHCRKSRSWVASILREARHRGFNV